MPYCAMVLLGCLFDMMSKLLISLYIDSNVPLFPLIIPNKRAYIFLEIDYIKARATRASQNKEIKISL